MTLLTQFCQVLELNNIYSHEYWWKSINCWMNTRLPTSEEYSSTKLKHIFHVRVCFHKNKYNPYSENKYKFISRRSLYHWFVPNTNKLSFEKVLSQNQNLHCFVFEVFICSWWIAFSFNHPKMLNQHKCWDTIKELRYYRIWSIYHCQKV